MQILLSLCLCFFIFWGSIDYKAHAAAFQNGSFEDLGGNFDQDGGFGDQITSGEVGDITGWTFILTSGQAQWINGITAQDGTKSIELAGDISPLTKIGQSFDTVAGQTYQVTYYLQGRSAAAAAADREIQFYVRNMNDAGSVITSRLDAPAGTDSWVRYNITFVATSSQSYISFENTTTAVIGTYLDAVSVDMLPNLTVDDEVYVDDPFGQNLKAIPGNDMVFQRAVENTGGSIDAAGGFAMTFQVPTHIAFKIGSISFNDGQKMGFFPGDAEFDYDNTGSTGMTIGTVTYSNNGGSSFAYTPSANITDISTGATYDSNVTHFRIAPSGNMNEGHASPVGFRVYFIGRIL